MGDLLDVKPRSELKSARRRLENIEGYELLKDLSWDQKSQCWVIHIRLTCDIPLSRYVPSVTQWYVLVSPLYPDGPIKFYPDKVSGITHTFQHQNYNFDNADQPWRSGDPCLITRNVSWGRKDYITEPVESIEKLRWHVLRCKAWIYAASTNTLVQKGDPFEFPVLPSNTLYRIVFNEDALTFQSWSTSSQSHGVVELKTLPQAPKTYVVFNFLDHQKDPPEKKWGTRISLTTDEDETAIWIMLKAIPVMPPWQVPETFAGLLRICRDQGHDLKRELSGSYIKLRRKKKFVRFVLIGFPVATTSGEAQCLIHWFAFELPNPNTNTKGFMSNSDAKFHQELNILMMGRTKIKWVSTENWNKEQLTTRGLLSPSLAESKILLLGGGALGSSLAEQLVRMGCETICLVDHDNLIAGNMSRHTLSLLDIGKNKAEALSIRLNSIFPFIKASFKSQSIQEVLQNEPEFFKGFDLVFDATANDSAIQFISDHESVHKTKLISISLGYKAERLFCFFCGKDRGKNIAASFYEKCSPWLQKEARDFQDSPDIVEGVGCWHPLFPSRLDDIQMLVGAVIKVIEAELSLHKTESFTVIEKQYDEYKNFSGIKIIKN